MKSVKRCDFCHTQDNYGRRGVRDNGRGGEGFLMLTSDVYPKTDIASNWVFVTRRHGNVEFIGGVLYCPFCGELLPQPEEHENDVYEYINAGYIEVKEQETSSL